MTLTQVARDYAHVPKHARATGVLPGTALKWYEMAPPGAVFTPEQTELAQKTVLGLDVTGELGFVIHHRCGAGHLLLTCTWRENNELWETVHEDSTGEYRPVERAGHLPTYCVWEMGVVAFEARAWTRYLTSAREEADRAGYLAARFEGEV
ncbi:hypothetical protein Afil01_34590 [Actinorhabdospora filicis]|uniref:Uncharacterized protein n=1 Tax=Actinorhabdospora filicis TaxID=1785913 RepID=A0A9W6W3X9_9ACTN|nr:hypothetical protein [Actinorhabdospora filicis]GLZ78652.1 hypothetical protein Afil01_34590 [Actinorhabdospora filicis]